MGWFANLFSFKPPPGISLDFETSWEVSPPKDIPTFMMHLCDLIPVEAVAYLEGTATPSHVKKVLEGLACEPQAQVAKGTLFPKPRCFHIPMTSENLAIIAGLFEDNAPSSICHHFHVYAEGKVLLQWHDAFCNDPFLVDQHISEQQLKSFCSIVDSSYKKATKSS